MTHKDMEMNFMVKKKAVKKDEGRFEEVVREMLMLLGEDPKREGLERTPERVAKSLRYLTQGYQTDATEILKHAVFTEPYDEMVIVKDIEIFSLCEHHMLPFYGKAHVAYIPNGKIIGLSKIPRLVEVFSKRLQVQERLTTQIAECLMKALNPKGVAVVIEALHLCMSMRGVRKADAYTITSSMLGAFRKDARSRSEFLSLIRLKREE
jgi:GTP cyclohydrolase I